MTFSDRLLSLNPTKPGLPCSISEVLNNLSEKDRDNLVSILEATTENPRRISNRKLHEFFLSEGYNVSFSSIGTHRRHECRCFVSRAVVEGKKIGNTK
jgi:hypothetical protein